MAEATTKLCRKRTRNYYEPTPIKNVPGVTRAALCWAQDEFRGTADALAAAGLLPLERFPGMPGQNRGSATLWPSSAGRLNGRDWSSTPGYMQVFRQLDNRYRVTLVVSLEEQARRRAEEDFRQTAADTAAEAALSSLTKHQRCFLDSTIRSHGRASVEAWLRERLRLAKHSINANFAQEMLAALAVYDEAAIERRLMLDPMSAAAEVLSRVSKA